MQLRTLAHDAAGLRGMATGMCWGLGGAIAAGTAVSAQLCVYVVQKMMSQQLNWKQGFCFASHQYIMTCAQSSSSCPSRAAEASKKDIVHFLSNQDSDVEVDSAIKGYMRAAYKAGKSIPPEKPEEVYELSSKVQRKYIAAQIVDSGIQASC
eukprot:1148514-Pelagomonas_calceolata.AAC.1